MKFSAALVASVFAFASLGHAVPSGILCPAEVMPSHEAFTSGTPVYLLELSNQGGVATMTKTGLEFGWNFGNGGMGYPWCPTGTWLNILDSIRPWKPLVFSYLQTTTTWNAGYNEYLTANATKTYSESSNFLACMPLSLTDAEFAAAPKWTVFLLTDGIIPTATDETLEKVNVQSCVKTKLLIKGVCLPQASTPLVFA
ncbi:hypothetical protein FS837_007670 [Tulasnella sp. UAMH 9824]|nr:hypothetical protein FS837_007670 [Tulasnella sp. UAMH 9824]